MPRFIRANRSDLGSKASRLRQPRRTSDDKPATRLLKRSQTVTVAVDFSSEGPSRSASPRSSIYFHHSKHQHTHYVQEHRSRPSSSSVCLRYLLFEITSNIRANSNFAIPNSIFIKDQSNQILDFRFEFSTIELVYSDFPSFHNRALNPFGVSG